MVVWKFPLPMHDRPVVTMPQGARVLHAGQQGDGVFVWALVDPDAPAVPHYFRLAGTGHPIDNVGEHVATFFIDGGTLVFHLFAV